MLFWTLAIAGQRPNLPLDRLAKISQQLRKERELSFHGDVDFLPDEAYTKPQAEKVIRDAVFCVEQIESALNAGAMRGDPNFSCPSRIEIVNSR